MLMLLYILCVIGTGVFVTIAQLVHDKEDGASFALLWLILVAAPTSGLVLAIPDPGDGNQGFYYFMIVAMVIGGVLQALLVLRYYERRKAVH